jgi:hypothetical protein
MSRGITTTLLAGLLLTGCITGGCRSRARDYNWYDSHGNRIEQKWKTDADGKQVPDPHPYDRYGRPWVYDANGELVPQSPPAGSGYRSGGLFLWGGSGYRSTGSGTSYRSGSGSSISRGGFGSTGSSSVGS